MSIKTETTFNSTDKTGSIRFYSDNTLVTEYTCDSDGFISMSNRTVSHDNDLVQYHSGLKETIRWLRELKKMHIVASKNEKSKFKMDINVNENKISFSYRIIMDLEKVKRDWIISKIKYFTETSKSKYPGKITFYARPAIRLKLVDFEQAVNYNFYLMRLITQLKQH